MTMPSTAMPSAAHMLCLMRNRYGLPARSNATTADALYTITMLGPPSSSVAMNSPRSDLSLRAICVTQAAACRNLPLKLNGIPPETMPRTFESIAGSRDQSSVGCGQGHQLRRPGQPAFPAASPSPRKPTDDCSRLTRDDSCDLLLEHPAALRVVVKHVEARARRREQHDA